MDRELSCRIKKGWANFWGLQSIFKCRLDMGSKIKVFHSFPVLVITYGAQT